MTLKLTYGSGLASQDLIAWTWPLGREHISFDEIVSHQGSAPTQLVEQGKHLSIEQSVMGDTHAWWVINQGHDWVCVVNGQTLEPGLKQRLAHGDVLEFGLTRFEVSLGEPKMSLVATTHASAPAEFDLTQLATDDPSLDFLLCEDFYAVKQSATSVTQPNEAVQADVFAKLHAQYLRRLENPWDSSGHEAGWLSVPISERKDTTDPMQALMAPSSVRMSLAELLGESDGIASVIHSLDGQESQTILTPEAFPSVMQLFAPVGFGAGKSQAGSASEVPRLTQREHNSVSLDSAISTNAKLAEYD